LPLGDWRNSLFSYKLINKRWAPRISWLGPSGLPIIFVRPQPRSWVKKVGGYLQSQNNNKNHIATSHLLSHAKWAWYFSVFQSVYPLASSVKTHFFSTRQKEKKTYELKNVLRCLPENNFDSQYYDTVRESTPLKFPKTCSTSHFKLLKKIIYKLLFSFRTS